MTADDTNIDLDGILTDATAHAAELPVNVVDCVGCHIAVTDAPRMVAEIRKLRAEWDRLVNERAAMLGVIRAAEEWAAAHTDRDVHLIRRRTAVPAVANLYDAVEQYRVMDLALTTARDEATKAVTR